MGFPQPPLASIDWSDLGFKAVEVSGHIESYYSVQSGKWTEPKWVPGSYLQVHVLAPGLNYGQHTFEGIKAFRTPDNRLSVFRPEMNATRQQHSNEVLSIPPVPTEHFLRCVELAVGMNSEYVPPNATGGAMYVRPVAFGSSAQLGLRPPQEYTFFVTVVPSGVYHGTAPIDALILEEFDRTAPRGTGSTKCGGNYGPVLRWSERAHASGYGITLHLDSQTRTEIDEFSTAGFVGIKTPADAQWTVVVPHAPATIIRSSTSESICELARSFGWAVEKRAIPYQQLADFDEICAAGTAAALVPVKSITLESTNSKWSYKGQDGVTGPAVQRLLDTLRGIQLGNLDDPHGWRHYVPDPSPWVREQEAKSLRNGSHSDGLNGSVDALP